MNNDDFRIYELPLDLPPEIENADPADRIAKDLVRINRLRDLLKNKREESQKSMRDLLFKLLEVADALERILAKVPGDDASESEVNQWNSIRVTRKVLDEVFRLQNVTPLDLVGKEVDPLVCEVDGYEERPDVPGDTVIQEIIKGYRWGDQAELLRPAVVIIARRL